MFGFSAEECRFEFNKIMQKYMEIIDSGQEKKTRFPELREHDEFVKLTEVQVVSRRASSDDEEDDEVPAPAAATTVATGKRPRTSSDGFQTLLDSVDQKLVRFTGAQLRAAVDCHTAALTQVDELNRTVVDLRAQLFSPATLL